VKESILFANGLQFYRYRLNLMTSRKSCSAGDICLSSTMSQTPQISDAGDIVLSLPPPLLLLLLLMMIIAINASLATSVAISCLQLLTEYCGTVAEET